tara:strand:- start:97 stop:501 length:405 start_codon:yes stop_codon:yes gene_type:complete
MSDPEGAPEAREAVPNSFPVNIDEAGQALLDEWGGLSFQGDALINSNGDNVLDAKFVETDSITVTAEGDTLVLTEAAHGLELTYKATSIPELKDNMLFVGIQWALESGQFEHARTQLQADLAKIIARHPDWASK